MSNVNLLSSYINKPVLDGNLWLEYDPTIPNQDQHQPQPKNSFQNRRILLVEPFLGDIIECHGYRISGEQCYKCRHTKFLLTLNSGALNIPEEYFNGAHTHTHMMKNASWMTHDWPMSPFLCDCPQLDPWTLLMESLWVEFILYNAGDCDHNRNQVAFQVNKI